MNETLGQRLRRLRRRADLTQRDLATDRVSYAYISRIEAGARQPSVKALRELAPKLGVSTHYLETGDEDPLWTAWRVIEVLLREQAATLREVKTLHRAIEQFEERVTVRGGIDCDLIQAVREAAELAINKSREDGAAVLPDGEEEHGTTTPVR